MHADSRDIDLRPPAKSPTVGTNSGDPRSASQTTPPNTTSQFPESARFPKSARLRSRDDFNRVYQLRCSVADEALVLYAAPNMNGHPRLGLSVSRKVGKAVQRNRWKRLLREVFRQSQNDLPNGIDLIAIPRTESPPHFTELQAGLLRLARRAAAKLERRR